MSSVPTPAGDPFSPSDADLILQVRAGSDAAFAVLYERHIGAARAAARSLGASRSDVDDLVAEAFTRVLGALRRGGGPEVAFRPYLMTCVRNAFYDRGRRDGRVDVSDDVPEDVNLALLNVPPDSEDARLVAAAFASLPERWQMVLWHTEVEGRPAAEVAPLLGLAPNAVAALAYRAREGLRQAYLQAHLQLPPPDACRDTVTKLGAYVRDGLSTRDRRKVDEHLKSCERCTALLLELEEVSTSLRGVLVPILLGVSGTAFFAHVASAGGLAAVLRWRPRGPKAMAATAVGVASAVVAVAIGVAALSGGSGEKVEAGASTTSSSPPVTTASTVAGAAPVTPAPAAGSAPVVTFQPVPSPSGGPVVTPIPAPSTTPASVNRVVPFTPTVTAAPTTRTTVRPAATTPATAAPTMPPTTAAPTITTTAPPAPTTTVPPTTTTAPPPPPPPPPLAMTATALGPAYAGVGAAMAVSIGASPSSVSSLSSSALSATAATGPVTITVAGAPVADWDAAGCAPGPTCVVPGAGTVTARLDLTAAVAATPLPITVSTSAPGAGPASATVTITPLPRPPGLQFFAVERGGVAMAANTVLTCLPGGGTRCTQDNNDSDLGLVSVGTGAVDSSSADLDLPAGAVVQYASLQWGGVPTDAPDPSAVGTVTLTAPGGAPVPITATNVRTTAGGTAYAARADVTALVRGLADPNGTYTIADVQTGEGRGQFGGWALLVAYRLTGAGRQAVAVFDDPAAGATLSAVNQANPVTYRLAGLPAPTAATDVQLAVVGYEGDRGITGDTATVGTVKAGAAPDNFFDSSIGVGPAARQPSFDNQYGFDAHAVTVPKAFGPADASLDVRFASGGGNDTFFLGAVAVAVAL